MSNSPYTSYAIETLKRVALSLMSKTAQVKRVSEVSDGAGGFTQSWANAGAAVACRITEQSGNETRIAEKQTSTASFVVYLPLGTDITEKDRLEIDNHTLEVIAVLSGPKSDAVQISVLAQEVKP